MGGYAFGGSCLPRFGGFTVLGPFLPVFLRFSGLPGWGGFPPVIGLAFLFSSREGF
jgi:hypothetical protein